MMASYQCQPVASRGTGFSHFNSSDENEKRSEESAPVSISDEVPCLPPHLHRLIRSPSCSYITPAVQMRRPRLWVKAPASSRVPPQSEATAAADPATLGIGSKRRRYTKEYESDDEDESSSDEDGDDEDECILPECHRPGNNNNKKARRIYSALTIRGTPRWLSLPHRTNTLVAFSQPLVTEVWTRPRTPPEEKSPLFYCKSDEMKFREEYRRERRLRIAGEWESDEEEDPSSNDDDVESSSPIVVRPISAPIPEKDGEIVHSQGIHQVTESSSSNEEEESDE